MCLQGPPRPLCSAVSRCVAIAAELPGRHLAAATQQPYQLGLAVSWLPRRGDDYFGWVKHFRSLKQIWNWIRDNLRLMNSKMISYVNSFPRIQPWFQLEDILHSTVFTYEFMNHDHQFICDFIIMNSPSWIQRWIHAYEFWHMMSIMSWYSSWSWIHIWIHSMNSNKISWSWIHMRHFVTNEFIYKFMYMKNIVISYLKSCVWRFQMRGLRLVLVT